MTPTDPERLRFAAAAATAFAIMLSGVSVAQTKTEVRYAAMPLISQAPIVIARDKGYFAAEGIDLKLTRASSGAQGLEAMMAGSVEAAHISDTPLLNALAAGINIDVVADNGMITKTNTQSAIMVRKGSSIKTMADLKGKKIASLPPGTITDVQLRGLVLPKLGLRPGADVTTVPAGFPQMPGMLRAGTVDAIFENEPFVTMLKQNGEIRVIDTLSSYIPQTGSYLSMITFRHDYIEGHTDTVKRFLRAYLKGVHDFNHDPDARVAALKEWANIPPDIGRQVPPITIADDGKIDTRALVPVVGLLQRLGILKKPVDVVAHVNNGLLP